MAMAALSDGLRRLRCRLFPIVVLLLCCCCCWLVPSVSAKLHVHVIGHSHTDVGWLKTVDQYFSGVNRSVVFGNVHQILDSVLLGLTQNPQRRFSYGEQAFFQRWYRRLGAQQRAQVAAVVANGQLEFINGGWCMHDEADTHYLDMIDQTSLGHRYIVEQFGEKANPKADTFGHSATHVALLTGEVGLTGLLFARIDYQDFAWRTPSKSLEWLWRPSPSLGQDAEVFASAFAPIQLPPGAGRAGYYGDPFFLCFNLKCYNGDEARPIQDDPSLDDYNVPQRVDDLVRYAQAMAQVIQGSNVLLLQGDDFYWEDAQHNFKELDKLIRYVNLNGTVAMSYSTPSAYIEAKHAESLTWPLKFDDEFPYSTGPHGVWSGYFTSRPSLKRYVRLSSQMLNVGRHWEVFAGGNGSSTERLWEASAVVQHHDAVAGTARQLVTDDYAMRLARGMAEADAAMQLHIAQTLTRPATPLTAFTSCPLLNCSLCDPTQTGQGTVVVVLYNPLARNRTELHSVPVQSSAVQVLDGAGRPVLSQVVQLPLTQSRTPQSAPYELRWLATVQGLGVETFFVQHGSSSPSSPPLLSPSPLPSAALLYGVSPTRSAPARRLTVASAPPPSAPASVVLQNECWALTVDNATGQVTSAYDLQQNRTFNFSLAFLYYVATDGSSHYSFEPAGDAVPVSPTTTLTGSSLQGSVSREVQVRVSDWVSYTLRLSMAPCDRGGAELVVDYVVGPVPIDDGKGKEVIVRYSVPDIQSGATFYTDREYQTRVRDQRNTWNLTVTGPAQNYYPVVSGLSISDPSSHQSLFVLNDRANGGASLQSGQVELMIHRRLLRGLLAGEALNETVDGVGLIVRGSHTVLLGAAQTVTRAGRAVQSRLYSPLSGSYAALPLSSNWSTYIATHNTSVSFLRTPLPMEVELVSLYLASDGGVVLRLAHSYGVNETDAAPLNAATGVTVDLTTLFTATVSSVVERTLTDNANKATSGEKRRRWKAEGEEAKVRNVRDRSRGGLGVDGFNVTVLPMEVRTFRLTLA